MAEDVGAPDGMTVDAEGELWVAIYGGGRVQRYSPAGVLLEELFVPAEQSTSCAFAGPGLTRLYVTTATEAGARRRRARPGPGSCTADTDARGGRRRHPSGRHVVGDRRPAKVARTEEGTQWLCALKTL